MWTAEVPCLFRFVLTKLSQGDSTRFVGVFNKTIIPLALLGCEMIIANSYPTRPRGIIVNCTVNNNYFEENIKKPIMNKKMVLFVLLVTTILLYDLAFNISCFFSILTVESVLYSHVIMASISEALQNFARLPYRLYIPSSFCQTRIKKWHANGVGHVFATKIYSNLGVLQWAMLLLLCSCLQQLTALQLYSFSISSSYPIYFIRLWFVL